MREGARVQGHAAPQPPRGRALRLTLASLAAPDLDRLLDLALNRRWQEVEAELLRKARRVRVA